MKVYCLFEQSGKRKWRTNHRRKGASDMADMCGDNRFEIIARAKEHLLNTTNIHTSKDEMKVLNDFLFRCWQMGWLDRYDRKTEPTISKMEQVEKPQTCDTCKYGEDKHRYAHICNECGVGINNYEPKDEPQRG